MPVQGAVKVSPKLLWLVSYCKSHSAQGLHGLQGLYSLHSPYSLNSLHLPCPKELGLGCNFIQHWAAKPSIVKMPPSLCTRPADT